MTSEEAKEALKQGKKVRHKRFYNESTYIVQAIVDEHGYVQDEEIFDLKIYRNNDWEIVE